MNFWKKLFEKKSSHPDTSDDAESRLLDAAKSGDLETVQAFLCSGIDPNETDEGNRTALGWAAAVGNESLVVLLLKHGANPNLPANDGTTPLMAVAGGGSSACVEALLAKGADPNAVRGAFPEETALHYAAQEGHDDMCGLLLDAGADPDVSRADGVTALILAAQDGHTRTVERLILAHANPNAKEKNGLTSLMMVADGGHLDVVKILISAGADLDAAEGTGLTALMMASAHGHLDIIKMLLSAGANTHCKTAQGVDALGLAEVGGHHSVYAAIAKIQKTSLSGKQENSIVGDFNSWVAELSEIGRNIPEDGYASGFLSQDGRIENQRAKEIGREIHATGGERLMYEVVEAVKLRIGYDAARELEYCWSGIGRYLI